MHLASKQNTCTRLLLACLILMTLSLSGCSGFFSFFTQRSFHLSLDAFPDAVSAYSIRVVSLGVNAAGTAYEIKDDLNLGTVYSTGSLEATVSVQRSSKYVGIYLRSITTGVSLYFVSYNLASLSKNEISVGYWVDYQVYADSDVLQYGFSSKHLQAMSPGDDFDLEFSQRPYYCFKVEGTAGKSFDFVFDENASYARVYAAADFGALASGAGRTTVPYTNYTTYSLKNWSASEAYLAITLDNLEMQTGPHHVSLGDITLQVKHSFDVSTMCSLDLGETLLFVSGNKLKRWMVASGEVEDALSMDSAIVGLALDGSTPYLASGKDLYTFDPETDSLELKWTAPDTIASVALGGQYLFVAYGSQWYTFALLRKSDFQVCSTKSICLTSRESVFVASQNRLYLYRDGVSPNDICYLEFDPSTEVLTTYGDSPYHGQYTIGGMLRQFDTDLRLVTGWGDIFSINDSSASNESKILWEGSMGGRFDDLLFYSDHLLALDDTGEVYSNYQTKLSLRSRTSPYAATRTIGTFDGEKGLRLIPAADGVLVVTKDAQDQVRVRSYAASALAADRALDSSQLSDPRAIGLFLEVAGN